MITLVSQNNEPDIELCKSLCEQLGLCHTQEEKCILEKIEQITRHGAQLAANGVFTFQIQKQNQYYPILQDSGLVNKIEELMREKSSQKEKEGDQMDSIIIVQLVRIYGCIKKLMPIDIGLQEICSKAFFDEIEIAYQNSSDSNINTLNALGYLIELQQTRQHFAKYTNIVEKIVPLIHMKQVSINLQATVLHILTLFALLSTVRQYLINEQDIFNFINKQIINFCHLEQNDQIINSQVMAGVLELLHSLISYSSPFPGFNHHELIDSMFILSHFQRKSDHQLVLKQNFDSIRIESLEFIRWVQYNSASEEQITFVKQKLLPNVLFPSISCSCNEECSIVIQNALWCTHNQLNILRKGVIWCKADLQLYKEVKEQLEEQGGEEEYEIYIYNSRIIKNNFLLWHTKDVLSALIQ